MVSKQREVVEKKIVFDSFCDVCGKPSKRNCYRCKKDVCGNCSAYDERYFGSEDYPEVFCKECWKIGKKQMDNYEKVSNKAYENITKWVEEYKKEGDKI